MLSDIRTDSRPSWLCRGGGQLAASMWRTRTRQLSSLVARCSSLVARRLSLVVRRSSLEVCRSSLVPRRSSLVARRSSIVAHRPSLVVCTRRSLLALVVRRVSPECLRSTVKRVTSSTGLLCEIPTCILYIALTAEAVYPTLGDD